jgi:hypothetical protein
MPESKESQKARQNNLLHADRSLRDAALMTMTA